MKLLSTLLFVLYLVTISVAYKYDCSATNSGCTIYILPSDNTYNNNFLDLVPDNVLSLGLTVDEGDQYDLNMVNKRLKDNVDQSIIKQFVEKSGCFNYQNPTQIKLVLDLNQVTGSSCP